ncbi:hypothetical protein [Thiothrix sp.]|uniref:hypothetical protein n=1 Tax=Thiothrix sp. TaxID=1032 RepID=UPI0025795744|nr:hypothetical protein [Thiothrix sp.]
MKIYSRSLLAVTLCSLLSACATEGGSNVSIGGIGIPLGGVEAKPAEPSVSKKSEYMTQGCVGGGLLGAVLGYAMGEKKEDAVKGFALGCVAGTAVGFSVAERTEQYASAAQAMDSEIKRNQENTAKLRSYNQGIQEDIATYESQINQVKQQKISAEEQNKQLSAIKPRVTEQAAKADQALKSVNSELAIAKQQRDKYGKDTATGDAQHWDQEIGMLEKERDVLDGHAKTLSTMGSNI